MPDDPAAAPAAEPISTTEPAAVEPAATPEPAPAAPPAAAEPAADPAPEPARGRPALLSGEAPKEGATEGDPPVDGEKKPEGETKPGEGEAPAEPPKPEPLVYEPPSVPDGVTLDTERLGQFDALVGTYQVPPEARQELVNLHTETMRAYAEHLSSEQHRVFRETRDGWVQAFENDPELGGNRRDTTLANALWARNALGGDEAQLQELREMLEFTGAGDHPAMIRLLNNAALLLRERGAPPPPLPPKSNGGGGRPEERRYPEMKA